MKSEHNFPNLDRGIIGTAGHCKMIFSLDKPNAIDIVFVKNSTNFLMIFFLLLFTPRKFYWIVPRTLNLEKNYSQKVRIEHENPINRFLMKILNGLNLFKLKAVLVPLKQSHWKIAAAWDKYAIFELNRPYNRWMSLNDLELFKVIIILRPDSNRIIITCTDQSTVIDPLYALNIVCMPFQNVFAFVFISCGIELPNPNVLVPTAWYYLFVRLVPVYAFYLHYKVFTSFSCPYSSVKNSYAFSFRM